MKFGFTPLGLHLVLQASTLALAEVGDNKVEIKNPEELLATDTGFYTVVDNKQLKNIDNALGGDIVLSKIIDREAKAKYMDPNTSRKTKGVVLGYVTPWNGSGYDVAKEFAQKFTHVAPCWFEVSGKQSVLSKEEVQTANAAGANLPDDKEVHTVISSVGGDENIDVEWVEALRKKNPDIKIVPRYIIKNWDSPAMSALMTQPAIIEETALRILEHCTRNKFDGITLELWNRIGSEKEFAKMLMSFFSAVGVLAKKAKLEYVLPVPGFRAPEEDSFTQEHFDELRPFVGHFQLITYDFSHPSQAGANSPITWVRDSIMRLFVGQPYKQWVDTAAKEGMPADSEDEDLLLAADLGLEPKSVSDEERQTEAPGRDQVMVGLNFYGWNYWPDEGGKGQGKPILAPEYLSLLEKYPETEIKWDQISAEHAFQYRDVDDGDRLHFVYFPTVESVRFRVELANRFGVGIAIWELGQGLRSFMEAI
eukprot:Clim_evm106s152 gene=Clim_evmTU106s152